MKKLLILIFTVSFVFFYSCKLPENNKNKNSVEGKAEQLIHQMPAGDLKILEIDGCEYIVYQDARHSNLGFGYMTHKGNCKNTIHIYNLEAKIDSIQE